MHIQEIDRKMMITGASSGIGRETAKYLAGEGCSLILLGRNKERLQETKEMLPGEDHRTISADLAEEQDLEFVLKEAVSDGRKLDGLVHCAGTGPIIPIKLLKRRTIEEVMRINVYSFLELVRYFSNKKYHNENSSIVAISSIAAVQPEKCQTLYSMSKAALNAAVQALAIELAPKKIRINTIMPGVVDTPMARAGGQFVPDGDFIASVSEKQLLGVIEPEAIAGLCGFLLSSASSMMTGRAIYADGGRI